MNEVVEMSDKWRLRRTEMGKKTVYLVFYGPNRYDCEYVGYIKSYKGKISATFDEARQIGTWKGELNSERKQEILKCFHANYFAMNVEYISEDLNSSDDGLLNFGNIK